jgi:4-amino-4-deoxy-L-arabinose transferase-like glycosyltransferase
MDLQSWLKGKFNKWRLALIVVIAIYAFLLFGLGAVQIQWDEMPHLYGGLLLSHGQLHEYLSFYGYYPPLYDLLTAGAYSVFGVSLVSGRIVAAVFALLSIYVVFEFAYKTYGPKVALIASILLGAMPGFYWTSRFAMLESSLILFFTLTMYFFYSWIIKNQTKTLIVCGLALGVGFLAKYQILVAVLVMIGSILLLCRKQLRTYLTRFPIILVVAAAVVIPWLLVIGFGHLGDVMYVIQAGGEDRTLYSVRFAAPLFYLMELTWPYNNTHPIFLPIFILGLLGLGLWVIRRKPEDKFFLAWFITVYLFFTIIPNRQWRYVMPLFPVLAISAASFTLFAYNKAANAWKTEKLSISRKHIAKIAAVLFTVFALTSVGYSYYDGYSFSARYGIHVPAQEVTHYVAERMNPDQSILVLCGSNSFYEDMVRFYLNVDGSWQNKVFQYPAMPIDSFKPEINMTHLVELCQYTNVKYVLIYEYGATDQYFNSTLTTHELMMNIILSGSFTYETWFAGSPGSSIWVYKFNRIV